MFTPTEVWIFFPWSDVEQIFLDWPIQWSRTSSRAVLVLKSAQATSGSGLKSTKQKPTRMWQWASRTQPSVLTAFTGFCSRLVCKLERGQMYPGNSWYWNESIKIFVCNWKHFQSNLPPEFCEMTQPKYLFVIENIFSRTSCWSSCIIFRMKPVLWVIPAKSVRDWYCWENLQKL